MFARVATVALLAAASTVFAPGAQAAPFHVDISVGPPPPRVEVVPAPRPGRAWSPGYWDWRGGRHHWVDGHWMHARPGYVYHRPEWVEHDGHWRLDRGRWER